MPVYWIWFAELKGISLFAKRQLLETFPDPEEIFLTESKAFPKEIAEVLEEKGLCHRIIDPADTRKFLAGALESYANVY